MGATSLPFPLIGHAISSAASPLLSPGDHFRCNSPSRSPVTPRRPYRPGNLGGNASIQLGEDVVQDRSSHYISQQAVNNTRSSPPTFKIGRPPSNFRKPTRPPPLKTIVEYGSTSGDSSPTELDDFLPASADLITPSLLPQREDDDKIGPITAVNIILGKTIGVGVYSVPSSIFVDVGSVGMTIVLWILGSFISFCGLAVYLDLGSALPKSGGERVYLERIFRRPRMLATCMFMAYVVLLGFSTPNCIVLGQYVIYALGIQPSTWLVRSIAVVTITLACTMHAKFPRIGVYAINVLGVAKMIILAFVVFSGLAAGLISLRNVSSDADTPQSQTTAQRNFSNIWAGSSSSPYDYSTALLKILYCFRGYNTANTVLSSVRHPVPTLKKAAPLALLIVSASYVLANIAYFCAVEKEDFRQAGVVLAGKFLKNLFGETVGKRVLPWLVIISAFGNVAATSFAQARVNQELGRFGLLPYSDLWAGKPSTTPPSHSFTSSSASSLKNPTYHRPRPTNPPSDSLSPALFLHFLISVLVIILPPPGQIYTFLLEIGGYPVSIISVAISSGLLYLQMSPKEKWKSPIPARKVWIVIFLVANLGVCILPWVNPGDQREKKGGGGGGGMFPYYAYPATGLGILVSGAYYWVWWKYIRPIVFPERKEMEGFGNDWLPPPSDADGAAGMGRMGRVSGALGAGGPRWQGEQIALMDNFVIEDEDDEDVGQEDETASFLSNQSMSRTLGR